MRYYGAFKVIEECGELLQELGKLCQYPDGKHPDGKGPLRQRILEEVADVQAAISYFVDANHLDITERVQEKLLRFRNWTQDAKSNLGGPGIDDAS